MSGGSHAVKGYEAMKWPLRLVVSHGPAGWVGASEAKLECGHSDVEAADYKWPRRRRCFQCARQAKMLKGEIRG